MERQKCGTENGILFSDKKKKRDMKEEQLHFAKPKKSIRTGYSVIPSRGHFEKGKLIQTLKRSVIVGGLRKKE